MDSEVFRIFRSESMCLSQNYIRVHFSLKYYKIVGTIVEWFWPFAKMYIYAIFLFYIEFKAMIVFGALYCENAYQYI